MQTINYHAPIDKVPIFVKAGAIIPMAPDNQHYIDEIGSPLTIQIYPKGKSSFELYEDDGESYDYEKGIFSTIAFSSEEVPNGLIISKKAPVGKYIIPEKDFVLCVHKKPGAIDVIYSGSALPHCRSAEEFNALKAGWMQEEDGKKLLWIKVDSRVADKFEVKVSY
jgi:hypothetical protein